MKHVTLILILMIAVVGCSKSSDKQDNPEFKPIDVVEQQPIKDEKPVEEEPKPEDDDVVDEQQPPQEQEPDEEVVKEDPIKKEPVVVDVEDFATLSWNAPTTRVNGDTLHLYEIAHYIITHTWNDTVNEIQVDYMADTYTFNDLPAGVHEFVIRTVDIDSLVSRESESVSKTIL